VRYMDEEKDMITCSSDEELNVAFDLLGRQPMTESVHYLRLFASTQQKTESSEKATVREGRQALKKREREQRGIDHKELKKAERKKSKLERRAQNVESDEILPLKAQLLNLNDVQSSEEPEVHSATRKCRKPKEGELECQEARSRRRRGGSREFESCAKRQEERLKRKEDRLQKKTFVKETGPLFQWPTDANRLFLDGNNMLYITSSIRRFALSKTDYWRAELLLENLTEAFLPAMQGKIKDSVLIFDNTHTNKVKTLHAGNEDLTLTVKSARPQYTTSDDALVDWAKSNGEEASVSVFVTSDRELTHRLEEAGGVVVKPKAFLQFANTLMNGDAKELDAWLESFVPVHQ